MKAQWQALSARFAALQQREKVMVAAAVIVAVVFLGYAFWVDPAVQRLAALKKQTHQQNGDRAALQGQLATLKGQLKDPDAASRAGLADARQQLADIDRQVAQYSDMLVAPERVPLLLQSLLTRHGGLSLVSVKNLPPTPLIPLPTPAKDAKPGAGPAPLPPGSNIYKHGIEIKVIGSYQSLAAYVTELERAPQKLLWGAMDLKVTSYPLSELTLTVFTLSLDSTWLIV